MIKLDIVERLRGQVRVPVNDGAGLLDGQDFFERTFPTSKAALEAADEIERLRGQIRVACDLLTERRHGNAARSPGHNARLVLEAALVGRTPAHSE